MNTHLRSERGQAIVVVAVVIVVLLGLTALAIDGGMVYTARRNAQNAADAAALAGALEKSNLKTNQQIIFAIDNSISNNGFDPVDTHRTITGPFNDAEGQFFLVTVSLTETTQTYFAQIFTGNEMSTVVTAIARVRLSQPAFPGVAIVGLGNCTDGEVTFDVGMHGGGNEDMLVNGGGIFVNSDGTGSCAINPPNANGSSMEIDPYDIWSVGSDDFSGLDPDHINWGETHTGYNGGVPIVDPLFDIPNPVCTGPGGLDGAGNWQPGTYSSVPSVDASHFLNPGIYCITGDTHLSGSEQIVAPSGVLLYLHGGLDFSGQAGISLSGPNSGTCPGTNYTPSDACYYSGMAIFGARDNDSEIELSGNGAITVDGLIYAPAATIVASGGGSNNNDITVNGQIIANGVKSNGSVQFIVNYEAGNTLQLPVRISLVR